MKIIGMMLVKNEADRWLTQSLGKLVRLCDKIVVLDDDSTDNTTQICMDYGCKVYVSDKSLWGTDELYQRKRLFDLAKFEAKENDWIICLDADEIIPLAFIPYLKYLMNILDNNINGIALKLHDMWDCEHYREDMYWEAHKFNYPVAIRYREGFDYKWRDKLLHCGRFPQNSSPNCITTHIPLKHMGWSTLEDRKQKYDRYMKVDPEGKHGLIQQYRSILDENPTLRRFYEV
jgi:glycosyltransferase involved in cell wall biosynthesis